MPGAGAGVTFTFVDSQTLTDAGELGFSAGLTGAGVDATNDSGLWAADGSGGFSIMFREGDAAPELPAGVLLGQVQGLYSNITMGRGMFSTFSLTGSGVNAANDRALYFTDAAGNKTLVVREGDVVAVAPGDLRTVNNFASFGAPNEGNQVSTRLTFTDSTSGMFLFAIPEPGTGVLMGAGLLTLGLRCRRF